MELEERREGLKYMTEPWAKSLYRVKMLVDGKEAVLDVNKREVARMIDTEKLDSITNQVNSDAWDAIEINYDSKRCTGCGKRVEHCGCC